MILFRAQRRQLRKAIGRKLGMEWRVFGHAVRRWAYIGMEQLPPLKPGGEPQYKEILVSRAGRWHRRQPIQPVRDVSWDALNREIAERAKRMGHAAQMRGKA